MLLSKEEKEFLDYFKSFYGQDKGLNKEFFDNSLTGYDIHRVWPLFYLFKNSLREKFFFDSIDREMFRDFLFLAKKGRSVECFDVKWKRIIENLWQCEELSFRQKIAFMGVKGFKEQIDEEFLKNIKTIVSHFELENL